MVKLKITTCLLLVLVLLLHGCENKGNNVSSTSDSSSYTSQNSINTSNDESTLDIENLKKDVINAFGIASEKEEFFIDFLVNRDIIEDENLKQHDSEYPFIFYALPEDHQFSNRDKIINYFSDVYADPSSTVDTLFTYPVYGPSAMFVIFDTLVISDNYIAEDEFVVVENSVKVLDCEDKRATVSFETLGNDFLTEIEMTLSDDGVWLLDESLFMSMLFSKDEKLLKSSWLENITEGAMNSGSATTIQGSTLLINIFVDDKESKFDSGRVDDVLDYLSEATEYLELSVLDYDSKIKIDFTDAQSSLYIKYNDIVPDDINNFTWTNSMFDYDGKDALGQYIEDNISSELIDEYDNYGVLFHLNKQGRSYAMQCNQDYDDNTDYYTERAIMFYSTDLMYEYFICPATYAHEILHLYGAIDLYYPNDADSKRIDIATSYFWNELMRYIPGDDVYSAQISKFTAFKIGLFPYLMDQLKIFDVEIDDGTPKGAIWVTTEPF